MEESETKKKKGGLSVLPWMRDPVYIGLSDSCPLDSIPFLDQRLVEALNNMGFSSLFPVQVAVWHETVGPGLFERDLCINSPTGSGKPLTYALPIVQQLSTRTIKCLRALVVYLVVIWLRRSKKYLMLWLLLWACPWGWQLVNPLLRMRSQC